MSAPLSTVSTRVFACTMVDHHFIGVLTVARIVAHTIHLHQCKVHGSVWKTFFYYFIFLSDFYTQWVWPRLSSGAETQCLSTTNEVGHTSVTARRVSADMPTRTRISRSLSHRALVSCHLSKQILSKLDRDAFILLSI